MFKNTKVKKMFEDDDPKIVFYLESKKITLAEVFKDDEDLIEKSIKNHKNTIAEAAITYCENVNRVNDKNQSYLMLAIEYDNFMIFEKLLEKEIRLDIVDHNRESALFYAIKNKSNAYFDSLIELDIDIKGFNVRGENTLIYAYQHEKKDICLYLLGQQIFVNHLDKDGNTILHYAIRNKDLEFALLLIEYGADVFIKNYKGETPLDLSKELGIDPTVMNKVIEVINDLFEKEENDKLLELLTDHEEVEDYRKFNIPFLIAVFSVKFNNKTIFDMILRKNDLLNHTDYRGKSLLMYCVEFGMFISARKIIYLDSDLNLKDNEHKTVLFTVVEQLIDLKGDKARLEEHQLLFNELLERKVDVNCQDSHGNTVLMTAIMQQQPAIIHKLIDYPYVDLNIVNDEGKTALMIAYEKEDYQSLYKMIHSRKAEINAMDNEQNTLIYLSLKDDNLELFDELLQYGADLDLKYQDGLTLLMLALNLKKKRFIIKIFEYPGFDVNIQDEQGLTALMHAIKNRDIKVVEALLKCGADVNIEDHKKDTAIFYALEIEDFEIAKLIRSYTEQQET